MQAVWTGSVRKNVDEDAEWRTFAGDEKNRTRVGDRTSILIHDMGLSTVIGRSNQDSIGRKLSHPMKDSFRRLREYDQRIHLTGTYQKNLINALSDMNNIQIKLSLPESVVEFAAYIFRKASERRLIQGRTIKGMVGACVYLACRNGDIARSMADIARVLNIGKKNLSNCYRLLLIQFEIKVPPPNPLTAVSRIANLVGYTEKTKRMAILILEKEKSLGEFAGKEPNGFAAAALYVVGTYNGEKISQQSLAKASGTTGVTIRNRIKGLTDLTTNEFLKIKEMKN